MELEEEGDELPHPVTAHRKNIKGFLERYHLPTYPRDKLQDLIARYEAEYHERGKRGAVL